MGRFSERPKNPTIRGKGPNIAMSLMGVFTCPHTFTFQYIY